MTDYAVYMTWWLHSTHALKHFSKRALRGGKWNISILAVPLPNIGPHFSTDAIIENSYGLKDKFDCTKLSARLITMPITTQKPRLEGIQSWKYREISALHALKRSIAILLFV